MLCRIQSWQPFYPAHSCHEFKVFIGVRFIHIHLVDADVFKVDGLIALLGNLLLQVLELDLITFQLFLDFLLRLIF